MTSRTYVPDTSVFVSGHFTQLIERGELQDGVVLIPEAVLSELERDASMGRESGFNGLDEVAKLQDIKRPAKLEVRFVGPPPPPGLLEDPAEARALTRRVADENRATLVTSDRVQAHAARGRGTDVWYLHPRGAREAQDDAGIEGLELFTFFDDQTMSVHLKAGCLPQAKKGRPGAMRLVDIGTTALTHPQLSAMSREIIEAARRDPDSFVEIERHGAAVVQLRNVRVAIARPPFADAIEITAVRPVVKLDLDAYGLADELLARVQEGTRGIFISGPPGSGKSTFAQALAEHLKGLARVVKTMESPRDLQVPPEITQYAPLEGSMELTSDVLLLVRPDYVIYDEVRKTDDFTIFADMRLAGVGMVGVTHANRAIDAIQRLMTRVELGMIPQIVDTVIHIVDGAIQQVLEMEFSVKVPEGMVEQDLARPVIQVKEFPKGRVLFEIYTYGEQTVVMPVAKDRVRSARDAFAEKAIRKALTRAIQGDFEIDLQGANTAVVFVEDWELPKLIGKGGENVKALERELGLRLDLRPLERGGGWDPKGSAESGTATATAAGEPASRRSQMRRYAELRPEVRKTKKHLVLILEPALSGKMADVCIEGEPLFQATVGRKGEVRVRRGSPEGTAVQQALERGDQVTIRV